MSTRDNNQNRIRHDLKAGYIFIIVPFVILAFVRVIWDESWLSIITAPDWSLASCIIFGQVTAAMSRAVVRTKRQISSSGFNYHTAKRFLYVVISCMLYFAMLTKPSLWLGLIQLIWFVFASLSYFTDGMVVRTLAGDEG